MDARKLEMLDKIFPGTKAKVESGKCGSPGCNNTINMEDFRDARSKREYEISGMCQECQDKIFGK